MEMFRTGDTTVNPNMYETKAIMIIMSYINVVIIFVMIYDK